MKCEESPSRSLGRWPRDDKWLRDDTFLMKTKFAYLISILFLFLTSCERQKIVQDEYGIYKAKLKNGLTVIIKENHASPLGTIHLRLKRGALHDPAGLEGIANLISEMHSHGTPSRPTSEQFWMTARSYGALITTSVSGDETLFEMTLPSRNLEQGLELQADALLHSKFDPTELSKEAEMLIKRKIERKENPITVIEDSLTHLSFQKDNQQFIYGTEASLRKITRSDVVDFYKKHYTADQMILTVVGDIYAKEAFKAIQKHYQSLPSNLPLPPARLPPPQNEFRFLRKKDDIKNSYIGIRFLISPEAPLPEEDRFVIEAISHFLGSGRSSKLRDVLLRQKELINEIDIKTDIHRDHGTIDIFCRLDAKNIYAAENAVFTELEKLKSELISATDIEKIKKSIWTHYLKDQETTHEFAKRLSEYEHHLEYRKFHEKLKKISSLTAEEIQKTAQKYFSLKKSSLFEYIAEGETTHSYSAAALLKKLEQNTKIKKKNEEELVKIAEPHQLRPFISEQLPSSKDTVVKRYLLSNNAVLLLREKHSLPLVSIALLWKGGRIFEETPNSGITQLLLRTSLKGTTTQNEHELATAFDEIGATVEPICETDFFGYLLTLPKEQVDAGLRLLSDIVMHPAFQIPILNREKQNLLSEMDEVEDHPPLYTEWLLYEAALKNHPYSLPTLGLRWAVLKITPDQLIQWHHQIIQSKNMTLAAIGDFTSLDIRTSMENYFKAIKSTPFKKKEIEEIKPPTFISENFRERKRGLTSLAIGFETSRTDAVDETALSVLETLTTDMGGRFGLRLRTEEKMSDRIECYFRKYLKGGLFIAYTTFLPSDEKNVLRLFLEEFKKLKNHLIDKNEFQAARTMLMAKRLNHFQTGQSEAIEYAKNEIFGKPLTAVEEFTEKIDQLTLEEMNDTADKYFDLEKYTLGIVRGKAVP